MLRRSAGVPGTISWRQFAHRGSHGGVDPSLTYQECTTIAREVKEYENAYLTHQIAFLETIHDFFTAHKLRHDPEIHRERVEQRRQGLPVSIRVFSQGELGEHRISKERG